MPERRCPAHKMRCMSPPDLQISTHLIHHPYQPPEGFVAPQPPVHKASTVIFENVAAMRRRQWLDKSSYTYGLHGTPTTFLLEERLSALEGGLQCLLVPSGLAAIATTSLALLRTGDEMLLPDNAYGPNKTDRKSTRLNSSHLVISYAVFCLKKKKTNNKLHHAHDRF